MSSKGEIQQKSYIAMIQQHQQPKLCLTMGGGYSSTVYAGIVNEQECAIKVFKSHIPYTFIQNELEIMGQLQHPSLVQMIAFDKRSRTRWLAIELCQQLDLYDLIKQTGPFCAHVTRYIARALLAGTEYLHRKGLAHRDIKPQNILLAKATYYPKLTDFGFMCDTKKQDYVPRHVGTQGFLAPELMNRDKKIEATHLIKCDMFALGVVIFIIQFGYMPFDTDDIQLERIRNREWDEFWGHYQWFQADDDLKDAIEGLLTADPNQRWDTRQLSESAWMKKTICSDEEYILEIRARCAKADVNIL